MVATTTDRARIWVLEDSPLEAEVARTTLQSEYRVEHFADGPSMLERLSMAEAPDVILMDWNMPGMSGVEVCRFIRQTRDELTLPILIFTATMPRESIVEALKAGANDFIPKPYFREELLARVTTQVRVRTLARESAQRMLFERQLIGIVSHDLRNPIAGILLGAEMLTRANLPQREATFATRVRLSALRCKRLISDILDFTQTRNGQELPMVFAPVELKPLLEEAIEDARPAAAGRTIELVANGGPVGNWDADRLNQAVTNLVGNALQYSAPSSAVRVELSGDEDSATITVNNRGNVISPEVQERMFKPMQRGKPGESAIGHSVGLGLYIVDHVVRGHGGTVSVCSDEQSGTTFTLRLPKIPPRSLAPPPIAPYGGSSAPGPRGEASGPSSSNR